MIQKQNKPSLKLFAYFIVMRKRNIIKFIRSSSMFKIKSRSDLELYYYFLIIGLLKIQMKVCDSRLLRKREKENRTM